MKRDMELVRKILLAVEEHKNPDIGMRLQIFKEKDGGITLELMKQLLQSSCLNKSSALASRVYDPLRAGSVKSKDRR